MEPVNPSLNHDRNHVFSFLITRLSIFRESNTSRIDTWIVSVKFRRVSTSLFVVVSFGRRDACSDDIRSGKSSSYN